MSNIPWVLKAKMEGQGYHFVGGHSAVKICEYTANGLRGGTLCYKYSFYGIKSWQCVQATPAVGCNLSCRFCWRIIPDELGISWNTLNAAGKWDEPDSIVEGMVAEQRRIVSGFKGQADTELKRRRWNEANAPRHVALSLTGEPTFYPKLGKMLEAFHKRGISTFLVSNGTLPEAIGRLSPLPTQLYISLQAPDEQIYLKTTRPKTPGAWERLRKSLSALKALDTRTVLRMTLIRGLNMCNPDGYAELIKLASPNYVEVKGFSFVGSAREGQRQLSLSNIPSHDMVKGFAQMLAEKTGYIETAEHRVSRIVLLCRDEASKESRLIDFSQIGKR